MQLGRYIISFMLLSLFILFAIANDEIVRINFPEIKGINFGKTLYLPIYLLISSAIFVGVVIGVFIEYLRNIKLRKALNEKSKKLLNIEEELQKSKEKFLTEEEKIFNLLE